MLPMNSNPLYPEYRRTIWRYRSRRSISRRQEVGNRVKITSLRRTVGFQGRHAPEAVPRRVRNFWNAEAARFARPIYYPTPGPSNRSPAPYFLSIVPELFPSLSLISVRQDGRRGGVGGYGTTQPICKTGRAYSAFEIHFHGMLSRGEICMRWLLRRGIVTGSPEPLPSITITGCGVKNGGSPCLLSLFAWSLRWG